ncbi:histone methyltransferase [Saccharomycopsis crataegensis]|uniref:Histone-lysine N-methyltransferase, H3 lysine-36 specific n=1 Tax=Saccharomycopsis crataegensis TaxID=43959 RepID=A0AAV5QSQ3_9ASCO|nr:histone methyltransferase [Saccharomycopsis crataegensis]
MTTTQKDVPTSPQLYFDEEDRTDEALSTFGQLKSCTYLNKSIGSSGQEEAITCDCSKKFIDGQNVACGENSDCINRLTSVECIDTHCYTCGPECRNQRFQNREYSKISVFQTEKKGYGVRAEADLAQGQFVYEYIGEVIDEKNFKKRMMDYDREGIKHFYFMMLQKNEFIDATKKGCLARFCNHSCSPNAYVDKWVVGNKLRMGIFAKRDIIEGEEICFDYNVDRYGAVAQPCYCGESNCIGFLGGKTQTDSASLLPQALADALGITGSQEKEWVKSKRKNNKKFKVNNNESNINEEFISMVPIKPLVSVDVPKLMGALMLPNQEHLIVDKLIDRIYISENSADNEEINKLLIRMHGYKTFSTLMKEMWRRKSSQFNTLYKMVEILLRWPAMSKNKITSSQIEDVIKSISEEAEQYSEGNLTDDIGNIKPYKFYELHEKTSELLSVWNKLQMAFRIRKAADGNGSIPTYNFSRRKGEDADYGEEDKTTLEQQNNNDYYNNGNGDYYNKAQTNYDEYGNYNDGYNYSSNGYNDDGYGNNGYNKGGYRKYNNSYTGNNKRGKDNNGYNNYKDNVVYNLPNTQNFAPRKKGYTNDNYGANSHYDDEQDKRFREYKEQIENENKKLEEIRLQQIAQQQETVSRIIEDARKADMERKKQEEAALEKEKKGKDPRANKKPIPKKMDYEVALKVWTKLFAGYVPNMIKKYEAEIGRDKLKACAKDIVQILSDKEIKRNGLTFRPPKELKEDKIKKVKVYTKDYMKKWMSKYNIRSHKKSSNKSERSKTETKKSNSVTDISGDTPDKESAANLLNNLQILIANGKRENEGEEGENEDTKKQKIEVPDEGE